MRFPVLDGWRGLCALCVALYHLHSIDHLHTINFVRGSYLFVDFFFVLSGFVIVHAYSGRIDGGKSAGTFLVRRFGRVWPLHAAVLLAFVALECVKAVSGPSGGHVGTAAFTGTYAPSALVSNLALVHALGVEDQWTWNIPSWSISAEFFVYITFALLCLTVRRPRVLAVAMVTLAVAGALVVMRFSAHHIDTSIDYGYFRCLYGFFTGCLVYRLYRAAANRRPDKAVSRLAGGLAEAGALLAVVAFVSAAGGNALSLAAPLLFGLVVWVFAFEAGPVSRLLATSPFQRLGAWSYSIYMVHALLIAVLQKGTTVMQGVLGRPLFVEREVEGGSDRLLSFGDAWVMDLVSGGYLLAVIVLSALTYRFIELPGQAMVNGMLVRARKAAAASPPMVEAA